METVAKITNFIAVLMVMFLVLLPYLFYTMGSVDKSSVNSVQIQEHANVRYITIQQDQTLAWLQFAATCGFVISILLFIVFELFLKNKSKAEPDSNKSTRS